MVRRLLVTCAASAAAVVLVAHPAAGKQAPEARVAGVEELAWAQGDPADSLYRAARAAITRGEYRDAARMFREVRTRYASSAYAADAHYWEAFALYRSGRTRDLGGALKALDAQAVRHPQAATRRDGEVLALRIRGMLAQRGDVEAAEAIALAAERAAPSPPPAPPREPLAESPAPVPAGPPPQADHEEDDIRIAVLSALQMMDAERALPILKAVLAKRTPETATLREKAIILLSRKQTEETETILLDVVQHDPDPDVRGQAVFWLASVPTDRAVAALDSIVRRSTDWQIQERAVYALSRHESMRSNIALREYVRRADVPDDLKGQAVWWLARRGEENDAFLREVYAQTESPEIRERILHALSRSENPENRRWLMERALDQGESMETRRQALFLAGRRGDLEIGDLVRLYGTMEDREIREQLIFILSRREEPAAVDQLIAIVRSETDPALRTKAVFWLGRSNDPRAAEVLLELINAEPDR